MPLDVVVVGTECPDSPRDFAALSVREDAPEIVGIMGVSGQHPERMRSDAPFPDSFPSEAVFEDEHQAGE